MEKVSLNSKTAFVARTRTNLKNINDEIMKVIPKLEKEAAELQLNPIEPMTFIYHGATEDIEKEFELEIAIIVASEQPYEGQFEFKTINEFNAASFTFNGSMENIYAFYEKIYPEVLGSGVQPLQETREVYHVYEGYDSLKNVVEIQIGINEPQMA